MNAQLLHGCVWHRRLRPSSHAFIYPLCQLRFQLGREDALACRLLSLGRFSLFSFHPADYGPRDGSPLLPWVRRHLAAAGLVEADGDVWLQTMPRMLGFLFNPISIYLCHDRNGALRAVLCEVSNTFGARDHYLVFHSDHRPLGASDWLTATKRLHVSPFCRVQGAYRFRFDTGASHSRVRIDYADGDGTLLETGVSGVAQPLSNRALLAAAFRYPWQTLMVWSRIHWQALRLWLKGVPFYGKDGTHVLQEQSR